MLGGGLGGRCSTGGGLDKCGGGPSGNGGGGGTGVVGGRGECMRICRTGGGCGNGGIGAVGKRCGVRCRGSSACGDVLVDVGSSGVGKFDSGNASGGGSLT